MSEHRGGSIRWLDRPRPVWRKIADGLLFILLAGGAILIIRTLSPQTIYSSVQVLDGDSLRDGAEEIRLYGIDAPEYRQSCKDGRGNSYACGRLATRHLRQLISNVPVSCQIIDTDRYDRTVAVCSVNGLELNEAMVKAIATELGG